MENNCVICGKPKGRNKFCCSQECYSEYRQNYKTCVVCGKSFPNSKSNATKCCSSECSKQYRQKLLKEGIIGGGDTFYQKRQEALDTHTGADYWGAKYWVIESPEGTRYKMVNLMYFIKTHQELFDGTVKQVYDGFQKIKASRQGKRKYNSYTYKGWKLVTWAEKDETTN